MFFSSSWFLSPLKSKLILIRTGKKVNLNHTSLNINFRLTLKSACDIAMDLFFKVNQMLILVQIYF